METASPNSRNKDRIIDLPDAILHHILSYLDIWEIVRTAEVSKRWRYAWKSVPVLNITSSTWNRYPGKENFLKFLNFVDRFLLCRDNASSIDRFSLDIPNYYKANLMTEAIYTWIYALLQRNVQEIFLQLNNARRRLDFDFPKELFHNKSLKKLELVVTNKVLTSIYFPESMCLPQLKPMYLPQLKSLCFRSVTIPNIDSANELFKSCPGLETLVLSNIDLDVEDGNKNFVINNALLQHLEIKNIWYLLEDSIVYPKPIQLDVPGLKKFIYEDFMVRENCCFIDDSSSLVTADIAMVLNDAYDENDVNEHGDKVDEDLVLYSNVPEAKKEEFSKRVLKFLRALHCVKELKLSPGFFEVLSGSPLLEKSPLKFDNLRCLKMELWLTRRCLDVIIHLLKISPNIESIYIISKKCGLENVNGIWEPGLSQPCMLSHLKFIEIREIQGYDHELKLPGLLLKNAIALEHVKLYFRFNPGSTDQRRRVLEFMKKLKALPRASSSIEVSLTIPTSDTRTNTDRLASLSGTWRTKNKEDVKC